MSDLEYLIILVIYFVLVISLGISNVFRAKWKKKHAEAIEAWSIESAKHDKQIESLQKELKCYKDMGRVIKIEKVIEQPHYLSCKFRIPSETIEHTDTLKRVCIAQASRYLAEELSENPELYRLLFEHDSLDISEQVTMEFRLLPYPPGVSFEDYGRFDLRG